MTPEAQIVVLFVALIAVGVPIWLRSKSQKARVIKDELPFFLDGLADRVEAGISVDSAFELVLNERGYRLPLLRAPFEKALDELKANRTALEQSLMQIGQAYQSDDMLVLASTLAAAAKTGCSISNQLRQQSLALSYHQAAERLADVNSAGTFAHRQAIYPAALRRLEDEEKRRRKSQ